MGHQVDTVSHRLLPVPNDCAFIDGGFRPSTSDRRIEVVNPTDSTTIGWIPDLPDDEVAAAIASAREAFATDWQPMPARQKASLLHAIATSIRRHAGHLADLDCAASGRLRHHVATGDAERAAGMFEHYAGVAVQVGGQAHHPDDHWTAVIERHPVGIVGAIIPWNAPLVSAAAKIAPALALGNCVVLKPSELSPFSSLMIASIATDAGLPAGVLQVLTGYGPTVGAAIVRHPDVGAIGFTGATETGRAIYAAGAATFKKVVLELGGSNVSLVLPDADMKAAIAASVFSAFDNAGQMCTATRRMLVHRDVADEALALVKDCIEPIIVGRPTSTATQVGPMISPEAAAAVRARIEEAVAAGASLHARAELGDDPVLRHASFLAPVALTGVDASSPLIQEETFGPVLSITVVDTVDEMVATANATRFGLSASVWTSSLREAKQLSSMLEVGTVWTNTIHRMDPAVPFGGWKSSGVGAEYGLAVTDAYTRARVVWQGDAVDHLPWG